MSPATRLFASVTLAVTAFAAFAACHHRANQPNQPSHANRSNQPRTSAAPVGPVAKAARLSLVASPPSGHWIQYRVDSDGRGIDVYVAHDSQPKPLVILLQGSGCTPLMTVDASGTFRDTSLFQDLIAPRLSRAHFAVIEKRGVGAVRFSAQMTQQDKVSAFERASRPCSADYLRNATKQARVEDVLAAINALARQPWVRRTILAGHSEGTHVATGVLRKAATSNMGITAAALFASAGPTPFYGGYVSRDAGDRQQFQSVFDRIRMLQAADDDFMYQGLPARRWKTFWLDSTPLDDVRDSTVPLFVAQGSQDDTTLSADLFALEAIRQQPHRPLRYVVLEQGNHAFETPDGKSHLSALFDDFLGWALDDARKTSLASSR
jgi:pimeloyl-ACP methyl ester carboxylesterase